MSAETDSEAVSAALTTAATGPASATGDAGSVTQQPLLDLIAVDRYLAAKAAAASGGRGLRFTRLIPDGTTGRHRRGGDHTSWRDV